MKAVLRAVVVFVFALSTVSVGRARADELERDANGNVQERNVVKIQPNKKARKKISQVRVSNALGDVEVVGADEEVVTISVVKTAPDGATLERLKVQLPDVGLDSGILDLSTVLLSGKDAAPVRAGTIRIDIMLTVPRKAKVAVDAYNGRIIVTGMRSGAQLVAHDSQIAVTDVDGTVTTSAISGQQKLTSVRGSVHSSNQHGNTALDEISGELLAAASHDGNILATRIRSRAVKLTTTSGDISYTSELYVGARVDLRSYKGNVTVAVGKNTAFQIDAYARDGAVDAKLELTEVDTPEKGRLSGTFGASRKKPALLDVTSLGGRVVIGLMNE